MAGIGPTDLQDLAAELLTASVEALDTIPDYDPELEGAPNVQFVNSGGPVDDCGQLTVSVTPIAEAPTAPLLLGAGTRHRQDFRVNLVGLNVRLVRCLPAPAGMGGPPPASVQTAWSAQLNADAWALWNHLWNMARAGDLFTLCGEVYFDSLKTVGPQGGLGGWSLNLRVQLEGYEEVIT